MAEVPLEPIDDWQAINDEISITLLEEMLLNLDNDELLERNGEALEKRYRKPTGTVLEYIFHEAILTSKDLLTELKKDTVIYL
jgi:hypothetical protein